jgi:hypothetical protein
MRFLTHDFRAENSHLLRESLSTERWPPKSLERQRFKPTIFQIAAAVFDLLHSIGINRLRCSIKAEVSVKRSSENEWGSRSSSLSLI